MPLSVMIRVRMLSETVRLDGRTKLLNPKWYEGMLSIGYEGVCEIEKRLTNTVGWSATSGQVNNWVYEEANTTFIKDEEMLNRLMNTNPNSFRKSLQTLRNSSAYTQKSKTSLKESIDKCIAKYMISNYDMFLLQDNKIISAS
ncbi:hypothetical protein KY289_027082 [Solanum tuberosum]|nr:hypothetical protein KY289_027082 [Solanum tuberosum]KAH0661969.1 hypothetical protein KY284_026900 [Solanum tuberosum]